MLPRHAVRDDSKERFLREARAAAAVRHDNIVVIHQVGEDRGVPFFAMEHLQGETLEKRLKREGALPLAEVVRIGVEFARALAAAHAKRLVHRNVKPSNIWLEAGGGRVKVLDFGLVRVGEQAGLTGDGGWLGTPPYMAPEQILDPAHAEAAADLFSLGCVLYEMSTGKPPFTSKDAISVKVHGKREPPVSPRRHDASLPDAVARWRRAWPPPDSATEERGRWPTNSKACPVQRRLAAGRCFESQPWCWCCRSCWHWRRWC